MGEKVQAVFEAGFLKVRPGWYGVPDGSMWIFLLFYDEKTGGAIWAEAIDGLGLSWKAASSLDLMRELMNQGAKPVRSFAQDFTPTERDHGPIYYCEMSGCADPVCCMSKGTHEGGTILRSEDNPIIPQFVVGGRFCALHGSGHGVDFDACMPLSPVTARAVLSGLKGSLSTGKPLPNSGILRSLKDYFR